MKLWNELSMKEKHDIIRESVSKGIHSLDDIKAYYDNYYKDDIHLLLEGGERNYQTWKSLIAKYKGLDIDNDNTYDYEEYYNAYPNEAWDMLNDNPEAHFTDEFKTVYHPTFSNESSYSGKVNMQFNPLGKTGGTWTAGDIFIPAYNQSWPNKFAEGGPEDVYTPTPNESDKIKWFEHWYNNREKQLADNYRNYPGVISSGDIVRKWLSDNLTDSYFARKHKNYLLQNINTVKEEMMNDENSTALERLMKNGSYDPYEHSIRYSPYSSPSTYIHERTHASQPVAMEHLIYNTDTNLKEEVKPDYYYDKPQEIYSRLNQFRYENSLDPAETITPEKLEYLKKNAKDYNLLNRYDDDTLLFLFNDVAYNPTEQQDTPNVTAFGGPLIQLAKRLAEGGDKDNSEAKAIKKFSKQSSEPFYSNFLANGYDENEAFQKAKQYYEEFKDSDKFLFDEGDLPEIIIKPSKNDRMSLTKLQRMIPDAASRQAMYDILAPSIAEIPIISQNESIDRLYNIYASSKYPTVSSSRTLGNYLGALIRKENLNRPNYDIITNTISIPSEDTKYDATGFIPELAHAYQYYANDKRIKDNNLNSFLNLPGDIKINGKSGYERPGNSEYSAHSIIEPAIWDYVEGKSNNIDFTPYLNPDAQRPYKTYHYHSQGGPLVYATNKYAEGGPKGKRFVDVLGNIVSAFGITPKYPDTMPTLWSEVLPEESYTELPTMTANQIEGRVAPLPNNNENFIPDFTNIKTKDNFGYNIDNLTTAYHYFKDNMKLNDYLIASLLANGIAESGFDPKAHNPKTSAKGLYLWLDGRYKYSSDKMSNTELLNELLQYINDTLNNTEDLMSWHHGGDGSGYNKAIEAHDRFYNAKNLYDAVHSFTYGYNRPDSVALRVKQRYDLALKILERLLAKQHKEGGKIYIKPENRGKFTALKKRTGHSASWFKAHGTPALRKMATFELNARHWHKHDFGGYLEGEEYDLPEEEIGRLIDLGYEIEYI